MNYQEKQSLLPTTMADEQPCERYDCQKKLKKAKRRSFKVAAYAFLVCLIFYMLRRDEHPHWNNHIAHTNKSNDMDVTSVYGCTKEPTIPYDGVSSFSFKPEDYRKLSIKHKQHGNGRQLSLMRGSTTVVVDKSLSDITVNVDVKLSKDDLQDSFDIEQTIEDDVYAIYLNTEKSISYEGCAKIEITIKVPDASALEGLYMSLADNSYNLGEGLVFKELSLNTANGRFEFKKGITSGSISLSGANSSIKGTIVSLSDDVNISTANGSTELVIKEIIQQEGTKITVSSANGHINVQLPSDFDSQFKLSSINGRKVVKGDREAIHVTHRSFGLTSGYYGDHEQTKNSVSLSACAQYSHLNLTSSSAFLMIETPISPILNSELSVEDPLHHHRRIVTDFEYGDIIGEGSYSTVLVGRDKKSGKLYAVKRLDKAHIVKNNKVKYVMIERDALSKMNHPGIVKLYWTFKDNRSLYFVLDLAKNGELYSFIRRLAPFDLKTAQFYAAEILLAIEHVHKQGVIHRDIKPENILIDDNMHIKLTDFGSAKILSSGEATEEENNIVGSRSFVGTAEYVSPELLASEPVSKEADYWAFGCVIYQMLSGKSPFKATTDYLIFQKIKNLEYTIPNEFPPAAKDLIQHLLVSNPAERLSIEAIKSHTFFEGVDWEGIFESTAPSTLKEKMMEDLRRNPPPVEQDDVWFQEDPFGDHLTVERRMDSYPSSVSSVSPKPKLPPSQQSSFTHLSKDDKHAIGERLGEQSHPLWIPHLYPNESIIKSGRTKVALS
ncbi:hypothetical protein G6F46_006591 [Rhizopus delemar]|nr:hypothetical protein G6F55_001841 [Rhizopus delemar]KAG1550624.1 hypothetical protein G6F51_002341 [Rhizopus arrhizus]KAG1496323.1 hypothetical protein G6F54_006548 [Rhizopus delemar]KAG1517291.1 hypothetical protein G6F53_001478 [Rhizopus delemar]KAG1526096.1 hypothetical protein G6F52_002741 [Rhizopus delemar]